MINELAASYSYCENFPAFGIAQPFNVYSCMAFVVAAVLIMGRHRELPDSLAWVIATFLLLIAGASAAWHLTMDPAALMAGEHARQTGATLQSVLGRPPCGGELYAAHFLGPESACKLIKLAENDPGISAASQFPAAAAANKSVFYRADGSARSVKEVYDWALRQPGASGTVRFAPPPPPEAVVLPQSPAVMMATRDDEMQMLLMSVMNWQPRNYFTGESFGSGATTLSMGPGLLSLLSEARES